MIEKYEILEERESWKLSENVNRYIKNGWIPQGGIMFNGNKIYQVMVKLHTRNRNLQEDFEFAYRHTE